jgi:serine/threonine-protein kinase
MLVGKQLGPFTIDRPLGSGAMGAVYRAKYNKTGAYVAIKLMAPALVSNEGSLARFEREASILKQLKHPNIVRLLATGKYQGQPFYAMEYIQGESLDHVLERRQRMTWEEVVALAKPLCTALQHAHEKGIIHRDLKPSNIMVLKDGTVKLTDFGIAKDLDVTQLTSAHCTVGTAAYMSPEQCKGVRELTSKSDLYSLGVMLYELITGRKPFLAETPMEMFLMHVNGKFERPSRLALEMPPWLDTLICQLLEKKPELRPLDAAMVSSVLAQIEQKAQDQKSAGVDAVEKRRVDRVSTDAVKPDEEDLEAARALRAAMGKKKKRKRLPPFLERKWVQACGILMLLVLIGAALAFAFKPPSAETLYARAAKLMKSSDTDQWEEALNGPIAEYLRRYGSIKDQKTDQIRQWADDAGQVAEERSLWRRFAFDKDVVGENDAEKTAFRAMRLEDDNRYEEAKAVWTALAEELNDQTGEPRKVALVAVQKLEEMQQSEKIESRIKAQLKKEKNSSASVSTLWDTENEQFAADGLTAQSSQKWKNAEDAWDNLKSANKSSGKTPKADRDEKRPWWLMAVRKIQQLEHDKKAAVPIPPTGSGSGSTSSGSGSIEKDSSSK